jgi:hypothetical protein
MPELNIRPPVDVYDTFGRLNYKPWYALAEFVDNATQNFVDFRPELNEGAQGHAQLEIDISTDQVIPSLTVIDNAHGMNWEEFSRALRINARPPDPSGRSEFGMGLKTAACWFGRRWTLRSARLGDGVEYEVTMDLEQLAEGESDTIQVHSRQVDPAQHGTSLTIAPLRKRLYGRQIERMRETLASMYRLDLAQDDIEIRWNGAPIRYQPPPLWTEILPDSSVREYRQPIDTNVTDPSTGVSHQVRGWVGILAKMSSRNSGFAIFRKDRLIIGGPDGGWRPSELAGQLGSPEWKRLVGELYVDSFPVNFSKDGFAWDGGLEDALVEALITATRDYRIKASNLRVRDVPVNQSDVLRATEEIAGAIDAGMLRRALATAETAVHAPTVPYDDGHVAGVIERSKGPTELRVPTHVGDLVARLYLADEDPRLEWLTLSFAQPLEVDVVLNTAHPFVAKHTSTDGDTALLSKFCLALALAEKRARMIEGELISPDDLRTHLDVFLKHFS